MSIVTSLQFRRFEGRPPIVRLDRLFDEWFRTLPMRRTSDLLGESSGDDVIRVDEFRDGDTQVIRAELPGIDPDKDASVTVQDGLLRIVAERKVEESSQDKGYSRQEMRYGRFSRTLPLPEGTSESDVTATYHDGILEIRVPVPEPPPEREPARITITKR